MSPRFIRILVGGSLVAGTAAAFWFSTRSSAPAPRFVTAPGVKPGPATTPAAAAAKIEEPAQAGVKIERDPTLVFQRAFWRRPGPDVKIKSAERREWTDANRAVEKWQWFVSLQTTPEFRRWLFEQNPFEIVKAAGTDVPTITDAPAWFPAVAGTQRFQGYRNHEGRLRLFLDEQTGELFATDHGGGFATAAQPLPSR